MKQKNVSFADRIKSVWTCGEGRRNSWGEERIVEFGMAPTFFGQGEELSEIEGPSDAINIVRRKVEVTEEVGFHFYGAIEAEFEANGCSAVSLLEFFFDGEEEVVGFFFVDIEFAIAGDAGGPSPNDLGSGKDFTDEVADEIGEEDKLFLGRILGGQRNEPRNSSGYLDKGMSGRFLVSERGIEDDEIDRFIEKLREGVAGIDGEWGEDGENIAEEHIASPGDPCFPDIFDGA